MLCARGERGAAWFASSRRRMAFGRKRRNPGQAIFQTYQGRRMVGLNGQYDALIRIFVDPVFLIAQHAADRDPSPVRISNLVKVQAHHDAPVIGSGDTQTDAIQLYQADPDRAREMANWV